MPRLIAAARRGAALAACPLLDVSIVALLAVVLVIIVTGGGQVQLGAIRLRARTVENPIWILTVLIAARHALRDRAPFLGNPRWRPGAWAARGAALISDALPRRVERIFSTPLRALGAVAATAAFIKVALAWAQPGFFSGDDVEIHQMTIGALLGRHWPVWELRSAFFPMTFIYPAQWIAYAAGAANVEALVLAGRVVVAVVSTAAIPLTWIAARRLAPESPLVAAYAVLFLALNKLHMSFGSSELPRPVSTVFVVAAFLLVLRRGVANAAAAGTLLGVAVAFRFSEVVFVAPALLTLGRPRYVARAAVLVAAATLSAAAITAAADAMYWGAPFSSVAAALDYTLVLGQSSRGYEPPWEYARIIPAWSTFLVVGLAIAGSARRNPDTWWLWTPIALLSVLPHKESRYLIPVVPFLSIAAARGLIRAAAWMRQPAGAARSRWARELLAPLLALSILHEAGGWRLLRSNEGVRLAQRVRSSGTGGIVAQDAWRLGGHPYLWQQEPFLDIRAEVLDDREALSGMVKDARWVALRSRTARTAGDRELASLGFTRDPTWRGEDYVLYARER